MKKALGILAIILAVGFAAAVVFFIVYAFITWPIYPAFQKEVDSYEDLRAPFRESNSIFLPEEDEIPIDYMALHLNDRTRFAKTVSYHISKQDDSDGISVYYSIVCNVVKRAFMIDGALAREYRGVGYDLRTVVYPDDSTGSVDRCVSLEFELGDAYYEFEANYDGRCLSEAKIEEINEHAAAQLETYAKQIIDQYRQKTPE